MKVRVKAARIRKGIKMAFFNSAVTVLQTLAIALGTGLGVWGVVKLLEGYGNDNLRIVLIRGKIQLNKVQV